MQHRTRDLIVGLTAFGGLVGIAFLLYLFGYIPKALQDNYMVQVRFPHAGGLNSSSRVQLDGVDIGRVIQIKLTTPPQRGVIMVTHIRHEFKIPQKVRVTINSKILGGSPTLALYTDQLTDREMTQWIAQDGSAVLEGQIGSLMGDIQATLQKKLEEPLKRFNQMAEEFSTLSTQWTQVGINIQKLTETRTPRQVDTGQKQANLSSLLIRTDQRMAQLKTMIDQINKLVGDQKLQQDIRQTVANTRKASQQLSELATHTQKTVTRLADKLYAAGDDLSKTLQIAQKTLLKAQQGQGSLGKLLNDPQLYNNLNDAAQRLNKALDEIRLLVQKIKAEGININL